MNSKKRTRKNLKRYNKKKKVITRKKNNKKGGAMAMAKAQVQKMAGDDKCDLSIPFVNGLEKASYSSQKMLQKLEETDLLSKETQEFKTMFTNNMRNFCGRDDNTKYLKFCSNLFNCVKEPRLFYEVLNDIFDLDIKYNPKLKSLYNKKKKSIQQNLSLEDFLKEEKDSRAQAVSEFLVKVLFKTITDFELKHPPSDKDPTNNIFLKEKFKNLFTNINISTDFAKETAADLKKKIMDKETVIGDYYTAKILKGDEDQSLNENKDERSSNFILFVNY